MKKLKKILLVNWLYFSKELIEVDDVNFLTGKTGVGKSTVIDALQIVLLGETNARNFNQAANDKSQRTLDGYLRADMDENNPKSRRGKDFSTIIACEFWDDVEGSQFVTGVAFDCRNDGINVDHFFIYDGGIPEDCFVVNGIALSYTEFRKRLKNEYGVHVKFYDTQKQYQKDMLAKWNVHNAQVTRMMKKAVSFRPIVDIQKFITENICDVQQRPDIEAMQQNIRDYQRHEKLAKRQEDKLIALQNIAKVFHDMEQATLRLQQQSFLVLWAQKEELEQEIDKLNRVKADCEAGATQSENEIQHIDQEIEKKEKRKTELIAVCAQSDVSREEDKLRASKNALLKEQSNLLSQLQNDVTELKREASVISGLCEKIYVWDHSPKLASLLESADKLEKSYAVFVACDYSIFSKSLAVFERAMDETSHFYKLLRDTAYEIETIVSSLKFEKDEKESALAGLSKQKKPYPKGLRQLRDEITHQLENQVGKKVRIDILADVLEIPEKEELWRNAVEGYLNTQKFYLLIDPDYYQKALQIYNQIKKDYSDFSYGLVDIGKLREREHLEPWNDSLAMKIETDNELARSYINYLLGRVVCCSHVDQLRKHKIAITADGMVYQGYVARPIRRELMENIFIGQQAIAIQISRLQKELHEVEAQLHTWEPIYVVLSKNKDRNPLLTQFFIQKTVVQRQCDYLRGLEITGELDKIDEQLSQLDLLWLNEQRAIIEKLNSQITALRSTKDQHNGERARLKERIRHLECDQLPELYQKLVAKEDRLADEFTEDFIQKTGLPRYQQELERLKKPAIVSKNFNDRLSQTINEQANSQRKLFEARREYANEFKPCSFKVDAMDNDEYAAEQQLLETSELPKYRDKIRAARESAMEQFQNDFLAKLKSSIDQVQAQVKSLNKALKRAQFGTDQYLFRVDRNPDFAEYYDMIMAPELMEGDTGLFALPFQEKYGSLIEDLFGRLATSDDTQLNARKQSELQQNIDRYTDFRTYLKFDLETTDQNGSKQLLSQTLNTKSGGETQTPFYIAVLASFAQLYQVNNVSGLASNTVRLVVFDEAFDKMDSERIVESVRLLRKMGLQAIICAPEGKVADIMPLADRTLLVSKGKYRMHILSYGKEILNQ